MARYGDKGLGLGRPHLTPEQADLGALCIDASDCGDRAAQAVFKADVGVKLLKASLVQFQEFVAVFCSLPLAVLTLTDPHIWLGRLRVKAKDRRIFRQRNRSLHQVNLSTSQYVAGSQSIV